MGYFATYLITANLLLCLAYGAYYWLYQKEENFQFNRFFLLGLILLAWVIPVLPWPSLQVATPEALVLAPRLLETWNFQLIKEAIPTVFPEKDAVDIISNKSGLLSLTQGILMVYTGIVLTLTIRFLLSIGALFRLVRGFAREHRGDHVLFHANQEINPFSFFKMIILNPDGYRQEQYQLIYQHELVHARQWHNLDILVAEIGCILCWFNPLAWKIKQAIRQNLEFIADAEVLKTGVDRKAYQYCLLTLNASAKKHMLLANHFNQSLLKKRILMMNIKKSPDTFSFKHLLLLPLFAAMIVISWPLQAQSSKKHQTTDHPAKSVTDHPAESLIDHPAGSKTEHPGDIKYFVDAPLLDGESVYGVIRADLDMEVLQMMKREFSRRGVELRYSNINFTADGQLSSIRLEMIDWSKTKYVQELNNKGKAIEGVIYAHFIHEKDEKNVSIGLNKEISAFHSKKIKEKLLERMTGVAVVSKKGDIYVQGRFDLGREGEGWFGKK